jgi:hypothetical protein
MAVNTAAPRAIVSRAEIVAGRADGVSLCVGHDDLGRCSAVVRVGGGCDAD